MSGSRRGFELGIRLSGVGLGLGSRAGVKIRSWDRFFIWVMVKSCPSSNVVFGAGGQVLDRLGNGGWFLV